MAEGENYLASAVLKISNYEVLHFLHCEVVSLLCHYEAAYHFPRCEASYPSCHSEPIIFSPTMKPLLSPRSEAAMDMCWWNFAFA